MMTRLRALPKMGPAAKIGLVVTGYVIALLVAMAVVAVYVYLTDSTDRDLSSGMHALKAIETAMTTLLPTGTRFDAMIMQII